MRMRDVLPGDVVNKHLSEPRGWVEVINTQELPNNGIVLLASSDRDSINGNLNDIVAVQLTKVVEIPDTTPAAAA